MEKKCVQWEVWVVLDWNGGDSTLYNLYQFHPLCLILMEVFLSIVIKNKDKDIKVCWRQTVQPALARQPPSSSLIAILLLSRSGKNNMIRLLIGREKYTKKSKYLHVNCNYTKFTEDSRKAHRIFEISLNIPIKISKYTLDIFSSSM